MHVEIASSSRIELCDLLGLANEKQHEELMECIPFKTLRNLDGVRRRMGLVDMQVVERQVGSITPTDGALTIANIREGQNFASSKLPFLWKLHEMLDDVEKTGDDHIVSWMSHGKAFRVHKPKSFVQKIIPHYFKQSKYKSFQRQLHLYDFVRTTRGEEAGAYSHPMFVRGEKSLCSSLSPHKIKGKVYKKHGIVDSPSTVMPVVQTITPSESFNSNGTKTTADLSTMLCRKRSRATTSDSFGEEITQPVSKKNSSFTISSMQCSDDHSSFPPSWTQAIQKILITGASLAAELEAKKKEQLEHHTDTTSSMLIENPVPHNGDVVYAFGGKPFRFMEGLSQGQEHVVGSAGNDPNGGSSVVGENTCCEDNEMIPSYDGVDEELLERAADSTMEDLFQGSLRVEELDYAMLAM